MHEACYARSVGFALTPDKLRRLQKGDFERFCRALMDADYRARFEPGAVDISGPHLEDTRDGGRDIDVVVKAPPKSRAFYPVLRDAPGELVASCKSHKDGPPSAPRGWVDQVRDDIDPDRIYNGTMKRLADDAAARASKTKEALRALLVRLGNGAEYCVFANVPWVDRLELAREFALRLRERARLLLGADANVRDDQVRILTANEIVAAFEERPFTVSPDLLEKLGGADDEFYSWSAWTERVESERRSMSFVRDSNRTDLHQRLERLIESSGPDTIWIVGAPGVGKTRAVHHFFEQRPELQARLRQTQDWTMLERWLDDDGPRSSTDILVVADEIPSDEGRKLLREFSRAAKRTKAKLVMIGPRGEGQRGAIAFELQRIDRVEFRTIIENELDGALAKGWLRSRVVEIVERLSQGYPLFAMWLTQGLARNPELLDEPGTGLTDDEDPWEATKLVLASRGDHSKHEWSNIADQRGRALLLAILEPNDWAFSPEREIVIESALGLSWHELDTAAGACRERGLLRRTRRGISYISPANLERLILNHYFGGPRPPLPPERLRDRLGPVVDRLLARAQEVNASASCRENLANGLLEHTLEELEGEERVGIALWQIARETPRQVVRQAHPLVGQASKHSRLAEELAAAFRHLRHRAIDQQAFAAVEDALFTLDRKEDWSWIFASGFHATYQSFDFRLGLLTDRLRSEEPNLRLKSIPGLDVAIDPRGGPATNVGLDDIDSSAAGPWEDPSIDESARRAAKAWGLLLHTTQDEDSTVADAARRTLADNLRQGLELGLWARPELLEELVSMVDAWTPSQRNMLGAALDDVQRYDGQRLQDAPERQRTALASLRRALRPTSFKERLIAQVGRWDPIPGPIDAPDRRHRETEADQALARELIESPGVLDEVRQWLGSSDAVRARAFGWALGEVDEDLKLLGPLVSPTEAGTNTLLSVATSYLAAWSERAPDAFDAWLEDASNLDGIEDVVSAALVRSKSSPLHTDVLIDLIRRGCVPPSSLIGIGSWGWAEGLPTGVQDRLIATLVNAGHVTMAMHAVGLARERLKASPVDEAIADLLLRLANETRSIHLPATAERDWASIVLALVEGGREDALDVIVGAIADTGYSHQAEHAIRELIDGGHTLMLWKRFETMLVEDPLHAIPLEHTISRTPFREHLPDELVMSWVGEDQVRATTAASLTTPYTKELDPLARALIERFGAGSRPAREIEVRACSTPAAVNSIARFFEQQAAHAEAWAQQGNEELSRWARAFASHLRERAAEEREEDELMRKLA